MDQSTDLKIKNFKAGFVCIAGLPSSGKSTFVNYILGFKLSIVSPKPQTTREHVKAILNGRDYQAIFVDTPGLLNARNLLEKKMSFEIKRASEQDADVFCLLAEPQIEKLKEKRNFFESFRTSARALLFINKSDIYPSKLCEEASNFS